MDTERSLDYLKSLYSVHVGNLPSNATEEQLRNLFARCGTVENVFIQPNTTFTYAFVRFKTLNEAIKSVDKLNRSMLNNSVLSVSLSDQCRQKIFDRAPGRSNRSSESSSRSIVRNPMPRMEGKYVVGGSKEKHLHGLLRKSMECLWKDDEFSKWLGVNSKDGREGFMKDFKECLVNMSDIPQSVGVEPFKFNEDPLTKSDIKNLILRYHEPIETKQVFKEVDFDFTTET